MSLRELMDEMDKLTEQYYLGLITKDEMCGQMIALILSVKNNSSACLKD